MKMSRLGGGFSPRRSSQFCEILTLTSHRTNSGECRLLTDFPLSLCGGRKKSEFYLPASPTGEGRGPSGTQTCRRTQHTAVLYRLSHLKPTKMTLIGFLNWQKSFLFLFEKINNNKIKKKTQVCGVDNFNNYTDTESWGYPDKKELKLSLIALFFVCFFGQF